jgi:hypothetical protein
MTPQETALPEIELTERQRRERAYHAQFAETHRDRIEAPVPTDRPTSSIPVRAGHGTGSGPLMTH